MVDQTAPTQAELTPEAQDVLLGFISVLNRPLILGRVQSDSGERKEGRKVGRNEMFYLTMHLTHFIYGYMASDGIWTSVIKCFKDNTPREDYRPEESQKQTFCPNVPEHQEGRSIHGVRRDSH